MNQSPIDDPITTPFLMMESFVTDEWASEEETSLVSRESPFLNNECYTESEFYENVTQEVSSEEIDFSPQFSDELEEEPITQEIQSLELDHSHNEVYEIDELEFEEEEMDRYYDEETEEEEEPQREDYYDGLEEEFDDMDLEYDEFDFEENLYESNQEYNLSNFLFEGFLSDLVEPIKNALKKGYWHVALALAVAQGKRDKDYLTDLIFFARYPERNGKPLSPTEYNFDQLVKEWRQIQNNTVLPFLSKINNKNKKNTSLSNLILDIVNTPMPPSPNGRYKVKTSINSYGTPKTIDALKWIANKWYQSHPDIVLMVRDISKKGGGRLRSGYKDGKPKYHKSHRIGLDADIQLRKNGIPINTLSKSYTQNDRKHFREFIRLIFSNPILPIKTIGFTESVLADEFSKVTAWSGHNKHLHVRFCMPEAYKSLLNLDKVYDDNEEKARYSCKNNQHEFQDYLIPNQYAVEQDEETSLSESKLNDAVNYNRKKRDDLGWGDYYNAIVEKILKLNYSPDEWNFAEAIANWQKKNGLVADGKIGPNTWKVIQKFLNNKSVPTSGKQDEISNLINRKRSTFGITINQERIAANFYSRSKSNNLRAINPANIKVYIPLMKHNQNHFDYALGLFQKTTLNAYKSGRDIPLVIALATRESGRTVFRVDNSEVVSAGKDTHPKGVSGLDYLYNLAKYFREANVSIKQVSTNELKTNRKNRKPGIILAKHLLLAHMIKSGSDERTFRNRHIELALNSKNISIDHEELYQQINTNALRTWISLYYSGSGHLLNALKDLLNYQKQNGLSINLNGVITAPSHIFGKREPRVLLARATSLRAYVFEHL